MGNEKGPKSFSVDDWVAVGHTEANIDRMVVRYGQIVAIGRSSQKGDKWAGKNVATVMLHGKKTHRVKRLCSPLYMVLVSEEAAKKAIAADKRREG
jgi:hypothetical protein